MVGLSDHISDGEINVGVPAYCITAGAGTNGATPVNILVTDGVNAVSTLMNGWTYLPTGPIQFFAAGLPIGAVAYLVGSCETVSVTPAPGDKSMFTWVANCFPISTTQSCVVVGNFTLDQHSFQSTVFPAANIAVYQWGTDCSNCALTNTTYTGKFTITATNTSSNQSTSLCQSASCMKQ